MAKLSSIAYYVTDKISSNDISLAEYVTTDCILQNKKGREVATNLPPQPCSLIRYQRGDVLIANIRPYLKKVWFADIDGGASPDVLVFRAKDGHSPSFLYAILLQDSFFDYVMQGTKGSKMPRGDKEQILRYEMPTFSCSEESIGTFFLNLDRKIHLNERINQNLHASRAQSQTQFELCRGIAVNAGLRTKSGRTEFSLPTLVRSSKAARACHAA